MKQKENKATTRKKIKKSHLILIFAASAAVLTAAAVTISQKIYYGSRWYKNTNVNGVDISGQTLKESEENLNKMYQDYSMTIKGRNNGKLVLNGDDFSFHFQISKQFEELFKKQHQSFSLFPKKRDYDVDYDVTYDTDALRKIVTESELVCGSPQYSITEPVSATVEYSAGKKQYICNPETQGNSINRSVLSSTVEDALKSAITEIDLTDEKSYPDVYKQPKLTSGSDMLTKELEACNNAAVRFITWNLGHGYTEKITPNMISKWITYKKGKIKYKNTVIENWVEQFCLKYKTVGKTRKVKTKGGKTVKVYGGDYGWQMDYEKMVQRTKQLLQKKISPSLTKAYIEKPNKANKKALTFRKKVTYLNTAFQMNFDKFPTDWDTANYTVISIENQEVYVFRKGKLAFSCPCITGRPVPDRQTPTGAYFIKEHRSAYTLTGADYSTPVQNWVRITWTGTGFHPATWQPWSRWTKDLYKTNGSHGCINLSVEDAEKIYKMTKYREATFIY